MHGKNYCKINDQIKEHLEVLIRWLVAEVHNASGDGDSFWYSEWFDVKDIYEFIQTLDFTYPGGQKLDWDLKLEEDTISWGKDQEGLTITNNFESYKTCPLFEQCIIKY